MTERTISVDYLARVEGEGALKIRIHDQIVEKVELRIFEPPRFFEALLRGREYTEAPDITARICGICPVAYQMSSCHAMEQALGMTVDGPIRELRRLLYCGEWIESHALHVYLLHAPDFLGLPDAIQLAKKNPDAVKRGLALKKAGNALLSVLGGRSIHPVNVRVGGFYRCPDVEELMALVPTLECALEQAEETVRFVSSLPFPEVEEEYEFVALCPENEYPFNEGMITSSRGLRIEATRWEEAFAEVQVPYSNAYHVIRKGQGSYLVGPLARYALNRQRLTPRARTIAREVGLEPVVRNPYRSILVRAVEIVFACEEALRIIRGYRLPLQPFVSPPPTIVGSVGAAATEAPRGILFHRYRLQPGGTIAEAQIVAPTTQNQKRMEEDVLHVVERSPALDDTSLTGQCERAIRNHDPCISCATHFLQLDIERR